MVWLSSRAGALRLEVAHQRLQVARDRPQLGRRASLGPSGERNRVSPEQSAFIPATQPRQLISAITIVMSATTAAMPAKSHNTYFFVSALRRSTKLMSCTIISLPSGPASRGDRVRRDVQRAVLQLQHPAARLALSSAAGHRTDVCG